MLLVAAMGMLALFGSSHNAQAADDYFTLGGYPNYAHNGIPYALGAVGLNVRHTDTELVPTDRIDLSGLVAREIHIIEYAYWANNAPNGTLVGSIDAHYEDGAVESLDLIMGQNIAEWAYDRPEVQCCLYHDKVPPAYSFWTNQDSDYYYWGHQFHATIVTEEKPLDYLELVLGPGSYGHPACPESCGGAMPGWFGIGVSAITVKVPPADLMISKSASEDTVHRGDTFSYELSIANSGPSDVGWVFPGDPLPEGVSYLSDDCGGATTDQLWFAKIPTLHSGETVTCSIEVQVAEDATGPLVNQAGVMGAFADPDPSNNISDPVEVGIWNLAYFALGDSVASGHGLPNAAGGCKRSPNAYPGLVFAKLGQLSNRYEAVIDGGNYACTGYQSWQLAGEVDSALARLSTLRQDGPTEALVSITIGADDFDFVRQSLSGEQLCEPNYKEWVETTAVVAQAFLEDDIADLIEQEDVYVIVTDYFNPFNAQSAWFTVMRAGGVFNLIRDQYSPGLKANPACRKLSDAELFSRTEYVVDRLNKAILAAAQAQGSGRVAVASVRTQFHGHESAKPNCGSAPPRAADTWIQYARLPIRSPIGVVGVQNGNDCFHPNPAGHAQIAEEVSRVGQLLLPHQDTGAP
jgi:uncharacterized repeat protein (TIGR01451 family)